LEEDSHLSEKLLFLSSSFMMYELKTILAGRLCYAVFYHFSNNRHFVQTPDFCAKPLLYY
jgi:prolipoprotein diacylglyceryltransferase